MSVKKLLLAVGVIVLGVTLFFAGTSFAQSGGDDDDQGWSGMMGGREYGRMYEWANGSQDGAGFPDHMDGWDDHGAMHDAYGNMMDDWDDHGAMHGAYGDMMDDWQGQSPGEDVQPLSLAEAESALDDYLAAFDEEGLATGEIMIFDNHAYAQVVDAAGAGAFELLVDPMTGRAYPEPGPNMMWNTQYGHPAGGYGHPAGGYGHHAGGSGMMHGWSQPEGDPQVTAQEAVALAQAYLDEALPGATAEEHADAFPGYYTLHVLRDGQVEGMLSVNAYDGDVFPHTWHGQFLEMAAEEHAE